MKDTRDLRDPELLGKDFLRRRKRGMDLDKATAGKVRNYKDENTIKKYGRPQDLPEG